MSAYRTNKTQFKNPKILTKLLQKRFKVVESHDTPQTLVDWVGKKRPEQAEIIIRRKYVGGAANDIGFHKTSDGTFEAIISDADSYIHSKKWLKQLAQDYAEEVTVQTAKENDCELDSRQVLPNGGVRLRYAVNATSY